MKCSSLVVFSLLLAPPLFADAGQRIIPAGALVSCTTGDGRISSKTTAVGDPVLCKVNFHRGDFMLPYGSYLGGNFTEYKDPGHFVGKGWMQLDFDRLYVGDQVIPLDAKVVDVKGYKIDSQGRILGKGHHGARYRAVDDSGAVADRPDQPAAARPEADAQGRDGADAARDGRHPGSRGSRTATRSLRADAAVAGCLRATASSRRRRSRIKAQISPTCSLSSRWILLRQWPTTLQCPTLRRLLTLPCRTTRQRTCRLQ